MFHGGGGKNAPMACSRPHPSVDGIAPLPAAFTISRRTRSRCGQMDSTAASAGVFPLALASGYNEALGTWRGTRRRAVMRDAKLEGGSDLSGPTMARASWGPVLVAVALFGLGGCGSSRTVDTCPDEATLCDCNPSGVCTYCGDNTCDPLESCTTCPGDCGACQACGDSRCDTAAGENCSNCRRDCGPCPLKCGDKICATPGETCANCPGDCGVCPTICGDGYCKAPHETCTTCPKDCGACPRGCGNK